MRQDGRSLESPHAPYRHRILGEERQCGCLALCRDRGLRQQRERGASARLMGRNGHTHHPNNLPECTVASVRVG